MKVFISSVIRGFEPYRDAADAAVRSLRHTPVRAEQFGARDSSPQVACLDGVRVADAVILLLGRQYGAVQASGLSATHEEYREARERKPVLAFIELGVAFEVGQQKFVQEVQDWGTGLFVTYFSNVEELRTAVTSALRDFEVTQASRPLNEKEALHRALESIQQISHPHEARLAVSIVPDPRQSVLRPGQLNERLIDWLQQQAMFGPNSIFDQTAATSRQIEVDWAWLRQDHAELGVNVEGGILMSLPALSISGHRGEFPLALVEEDVQHRIERALRFGAGVLDQTDPLSRLSHIVVVVGLFRADYLGWLTEAEAARRPNSVTIGFPSQNPPVVQLSPPSRRRQELKLSPLQLAEDFTVLLKRQRRQ